MPDGYTIKIQLVRDDGEVLITMESLSIESAEMDLGRLERILKKKNL